MLAPVSPADLL
jgi:hypothetical protein